MKDKMVTGFTKDTFVIDVFDGKRWQPYSNGTRFSRQAAVKTYEALSRGGAMVRVHDGYENHMDVDELSGKNAALRLTDAYQLGWKECWDWLKSHGGAW